MQVKGDTSRISLGYNASVGRHILVSNNYSDMQSLLESGHSLETVVGWLEMTPETFPTESCLFDTPQCTDGFTIQFWFKANDCETQVSEINRSMFLNNS